MSVITGEHLRIARIIYGFDSQEMLGNELGVSLGTIQRYEALEDVDAKVRGIYEHQLGFDLSRIVITVEKMRTERANRQLMAKSS